MIDEHFYSVRKEVMLLLTIDDISIMLLMNSDDTVIVRFFKMFFSVRLLSVLSGHSVFSSPPQRPMTSDFEGFLYQILSITFIVLS